MCIYIYISMNVVGTSSTILYKKFFLDQTFCHNLMLYVSMIGGPSLSPLTTTFSPLHTDSSKKRVQKHL